VGWPWNEIHPVIKKQWITNYDVDIRNWIGECRESSVNIWLWDLMFLVSIKTTAFRDLSPRSLAVSCAKLVPIYQTKRRHIPEDNDRNWLRARRTYFCSRYWHFPFATQPDRLWNPPSLLPQLPSPGTERQKREAFHLYTPKVLP
jgi:hypothetical protein